MSRRIDRGGNHSSSTATTTSRRARRRAKKTNPTNSSSWLFVFFVLSWLHLHAFDGGRVLPAGSSRADDPPLLTLREAMQEALQKNQRMLDQHDVTEQADLGLRLAHNPVTPKVVPDILGSLRPDHVNNP